MEILKAEKYSKFELKFKLDAFLNPTKTILTEVKFCRVGSKHGARIVGKR